MTSTYTPGGEVSSALIALFRADVAFRNPDANGVGGLLYPDWSPKRRDGDERVWTNHVPLPKDLPDVLTALPRVLFDITWRPHEYEQEQPGILSGPVSVWLHVLAPREQEAYGDSIVAAVILRLLSTRLSSARIIAGDLTATSDVVRDPLETFSGAWEWRAGFRSANVGVLL